MAPTKKTGLATPDPEKRGELVKPDALNASLVIDALTGKVDPTKLVFARDIDATAKRIAEKDAAATSLADLFEGDKLVSGKDYADKPFRLDSVEWQDSELPGAEALPFYAVIHGTDARGEPVTIGCGAANVMRRAAVIITKGWAPCWVKIVKAKTDPVTGFTPLNLVDASEYAPFE